MLNIITHRHLAMDTTVIAHGMDARQTGRFKAVSASPTKGQLVEVGQPGMDVHLITPYIVQNGVCIPYRSY
jgi:hypothetical protein